MTSAKAMGKQSPPEDSAAVRRCEQLASGAESRESRTASRSVARSYAIHVTASRKLSVRPFMEDLLAALHDNPAFVPTHWGIERNEKREFEPRSFMAALARTAERWPHTWGWSQMSLRRTKAPRYLMWISPIWTHLHLGGLKVAFTGKIAQKYPEAIFTLGSRLAEIANVAHGIVHVGWNVSGEQLDYEHPLRCRLQQFGPGPPAARTWLGPHTVALVGREVLEPLFAVLRDLPDGGVEADLVANPWDAGLDALHSAQRAAWHRLQQTGVFCDYSAAPPCPAAHNWDRTDLAIEAAPKWTRAPYLSPAPKPDEGT